MLLDESCSWKLQKYSIRFHNIDQNPPSYSQECFSLSLLFPITGRATAIILRYSRDRILGISMRRLNESFSCIISRSASSLSHLFVWHPFPYERIHPFVSCRASAAGSGWISRDFPTFDTSCGNFKKSVDAERIGNRLCK